jgi:hypothetical protein
MAFAILKLSYLSYCFLRGAMMKATKTWVHIILLLISAINVYAWPIPDTGQAKCYNNTDEIPCPEFFQVRDLDMVMHDGCRKRFS